MVTVIVEFLIGGTKMRMASKISLDLSSQMPKDLQELENMQYAITMGFRFQFQRRSLQTS